MEPLIVQTARAFKAALLANEEAQQRRMAASWGRVAQALDTGIMLLANEVSERRANGENVTSTALFRLARYRSLLAQVNDEVSQYVRETWPGVQGYQRDLTHAGLDNATALLRAAGLRSFATLPTGAVETMVGLAGDGSPLLAMLRANVVGAAVEGITNALVRGVALGINPRIVARQVAQGSNLGLQRALVITRNESLRAYRESSRMQYEASGAVAGFRRLATKDARTCIACLVKDGEVYTVNEALRAHTQCRCTTVPIVRGLEAPTWQTGAQWLREQDSATQQRIMGAGRYQAWRDGVALDRMATVAKDATWGDAAVPTPVARLR